MSMLDAAGVPALRDPDDGAWQHTGALTDPVGVLGPMSGRVGAVKVFPGQVGRLQVRQWWPTAVLAPVRPWAESNASWVGLGHPPLLPEARCMEADRCLRDNWARAGVPVHDVPFHDLVDHPQRTAVGIARHVGIHPSRARDMAVLVDPAMRHYP